MKFSITIETNEAPVIDFCEKCEGKDKYEIGDIISFKLDDGEEVEAMAVQKDAWGNTIFCFVDCLKKEYPMNERSTNEGGYEKSDLRRWLNGEIVARFPKSIRDRLIPFDNGDYLRIPTEKEIFGKNEIGEDEPETTEQWEPMKRRRNRMAFQGKEGSFEWYWLQNRRRDVVSSAVFALVGDDGNCIYVNASYSFGVRPAFKI